MIVLLIFFLLTPLAMAYYPCKASYGNSDILFRLATGSPGALGLLEDLAKAFSATHGTTVCWVKAGSGKSLKLLQAGQVDVVMVHAPATEKKANEVNGYFMIDSSTWVAGKKVGWQEKKD